MMRASDKQGDNVDMTCAFQELGKLGTGVLSYSSEDSAVIAPMETISVLEEDCHSFYELAAAGHAFMNHLSQKEAKCQKEFAAISRAGLGFVSSQNKYPPTAKLFGRDADMTRAALFNLDRHAQPPLDDWAFQDLAEAVGDCFSWQRTPKFTFFMQLPAEIRLKVIHEYLRLESANTCLSNNHAHWDEWGNECCFWKFPSLLVACDNQQLQTFPPSETARAPKGWLPALAFASTTILGEVTVHMLQNTKRIDLKYIKENSTFSIATWFRKFLAAIPGGDGINAVKHLNFPHMHWFNSMAQPPALTNPSVELMAACKNLRKVDMTFHASTLNRPDPNQENAKIPLTALELVEKFYLGPLLECDRVQEIYFDGIYVPVKFGGSPSDLDPILELAKWLMKEFLARRSQKVQVEVARRTGRWLGCRVAGRAVELDEKDA
jgi:hypothetical protein